MNQDNHKSSRMNQQGGVVNFLTKPIYTLLLNATSSLSEHEIICHLKNDGHLITHADNNSQLTLFKTHFLVMNALYALQELVWAEGKTLSISALAIEVRPLADGLGENLLSNEADAIMREYYLDWSNLEKTTNEDVEMLLNGFWEKYLAYDNRYKYLNILGLNHDACWDDISICYRRLISEHHPDMGGEDDRFIEIREAYEQLKQLYS